jgi:hypothetical protein
VSNASSHTDANPSTHSDANIGTNTNANPSTHADLNATTNAPPGNMRRLCLCITVRIWPDGNQ